MERLVVGLTVLELVKGDITKQSTEAIVNAANAQLAPGGGVAGALPRAAGPSLWEACRKLDGCRTGEAKLTSGYNLEARFVIHTVGPVYSGSIQDSEDLRACYLNSLRLADEKGITSISFPAISTGAFRYPIEEASRISLSAVRDYIMMGTRIKLVRFMLFVQVDYDAYREALKLLARNCTGAS